MLQIPHLYIHATDEKGRGVYSGMDLSPGDVIELCPVIIVPKDQIQWLDKTELFEYYFLWGEEGHACIALGYGSLYNHNDSPNAEAINLLNDQMIRIQCVKDIDAGNEITISYTSGKASHGLWF